MTQFVKVISPEEYQICLDIRNEVFIKEQSVTIEEEVDSLEDACLHFLLYKDNTPVATARLFPVSDECCKIQRVAVLKKYRRKGYGKVIIINLIDYAKTNHYKKIKLSAQTNALRFYEKLGFTAYGEVYMDANIPHRAMVYQSL